MSAGWVLSNCVIICSGSKSTPLLIELYLVASIYPILILGEISVCYVYLENNIPPKMNLLN